MTETTKSEFAKALDRVARLLTSRDHSRHELQEKLARHFDSELIERVLDEALSRGWMPSEEALAIRAAALYRRALKSHRYIEAQLVKRGLPVPPPDEESELVAIRNLIERKFGPVAELERDQHNQVYRYLKYRGFEDHGIRQVLNEK